MSIIIQLRELNDLLRNFELELDADNLREKVLALVPVIEKARAIGSNLIDAEGALSARERILLYFRKYPRQVISGNELMVISAIQEYARRVRELRVEFGWRILSGVTILEAVEDGDPELSAIAANMGPDDYMLLSEEQDKMAAFRWRCANDIRKRKLSVRNKLLEFLKLNVGNVVTLEELRYVANISEWARRVRELRTEYGWQIRTRTTGRPDLGVGEYLLESLDQGLEHDRRISDKVRVAVLERDKYTCRNCGWNQSRWSVDDPRHIELHHEVHHVRGGTNTEDNLIALCNRCHDEVHRRSL